MKDNKNSFVCIGAVHMDNILQLQKNYFKYRTNPIIQKELLGGVAYNIALKLSFFKKKIELISLNCKNEIKTEISKNKIKFIPLTKAIVNRSYFSILNFKSSILDFTHSFILCVSSNSLVKCSRL